MLPVKSESDRENARAPKKVVCINQMLVSGRTAEEGIERCRTPLGIPSLLGRVAA